MPQDEQPAATSPGQLAFALRPPRDLTEARFVQAVSNAEARKWLAQTAWPDRRLWLWGPEGAGKTHLLHVWATRRNAIVVDARMLKPGTNPLNDRVHELSDVKALAIDSIERCADEITLLHLLNTARERRVTLLLAARHPPARLHVDLPDLASRLRAMSAVAVGPPDDALRATLLLRLLAERQLVVPQPVTDWLWQQLPRTGGAILAAVQRLDEAALAHGRPVTRALARSVLADLLEPDLSALDEGGVVDDVSMTDTSK